MRRHERAEFLDCVTGQHPLLDQEGMTKEYDTPPLSTPCRCESLNPQWQSYLNCATCGGLIPIERTDEALRLVREQLL